jgi:hypothetical protein
MQELHSLNARATLDSKKPQELLAPGAISLHDMEQIIIMARRAHCMRGTLVLKRQTI